MATKKGEKEWTDRDEVAARMLAAIVTGRLASGRGLEANGASEAAEAYRFADAFLSVRDGNQT